MSQSQAFSAGIFTFYTLVAVVMLVLAFKDPNSRVIQKVGSFLLLYGFALFALASWLLQIIDFPFLLKMSGAVALAAAFVSYCVDSIMDTIKDFRAARALRTTAPQDPQ